MLLIKKQVPSQILAEPNTMHERELTYQERETGISRTQLFSFPVTKYTKKVQAPNV